MFIQILFIASTLLIVGSTMAMLLTRDLMHACVFMLSTLLGVAGLYLTLGADFVAVTQVMVYVGGVVVLMLFAVMLTGGKDFTSPRSKNSLKQIPLMGNKFTYGVGVLSAGVLLLILIKLGRGLMNLSKPQLLPYQSTVEKIGELLITEHVLAFEISSVLLLGALVGAAIIARPQKGS